MPNTARTVRCRKCHTAYDHVRQPKCPRCGAPSKPTSGSVPAVPPPGAAPAPKPKKERMTPLMKIASKGEALVYGTPSVNEPVRGKGREKRQANNTPIVIGGVLIVVVIIGALLAINSNETPKKTKKPQQSTTEAPAQRPQAPAPAAAPASPPSDPLLLPPSQPAAKPPDKNIDPLDAEAQQRKQAPPTPGPGPEANKGKPSDDTPPAAPRAPKATWKGADPGVKSELAPLLKEMQDWPTAKIDEEVKNLQGRAQEAIPALIELVDNDDEMASHWACELLHRLTGKNMGAPMGMSPSERRDLSEHWKSAFLQNGAAPEGPTQEAEDEKSLNKGIEWARKFAKCRFPGDDDKCVADLSATGDKELVKGLILVVGSDDKALAANADKFLSKLTGQAMGGSSAKWLEWWKANESSWKFPN